MFYCQLNNLYDLFLYAHQSVKTTNFANLKINNRLFIILDDYKYPTYQVVVEEYHTSPVFLCIVMSE